MLTFRTKRCYEKHNSSCRKKIKCPQCQKILTVKTIETQEQVLQNHECSEPGKNCQKCHLNHLPDRCKMQTPLVKTSNHPSIAIVVIGINDSNQMNCLLCYESNSACSYHEKNDKDIEILPFNLLCYRESTRHGYFIFEEYTHDYYRYEKLESRHFYPNHGNGNKVSNVKRRKNFGWPEKSYGVDTLLKQTPVSPLDSFVMRMVLDKKMTNTLVVGYQNFLFLIMQALYRLGLKPVNIIRKGSEILKIDIQNNNVSFTTVEAYSAKRFDDIQIFMKVNNSEMHFFPKCLINSKDLVDTMMDVPNEKLFLKNSDNEAIADAKRKFVKNLPKKWSPKSEFHKSLKLRLDLLLSFVIRLLHLSKEIQSAFRDQLNLPNVPYMHILNMNTWPGFAYQNLQNFCLKYANIYAVDSPDKGKNTHNTSK